MAVALDQPVFVVGLPEVDQGEAEFLDGPEGPDPEQVLLQRPDEPLGAAVALGRADEGGRGRWRRARRSPSGSRGTCTGCRGRGGWRGRGCLLLDAAEALGHALPDRLQRLVARAVESGVDADAFRRAMVDGDEDRDLAVLDGEGCGHVGSPHRVDRLRDDRAVVVARAAGAAGAGRRLQAVLAHQAAHPLLRGAQARMAQPRPDLAVALAMKRAVDEHLPDRLDQRGVGHRPLRPRPAPWLPAARPLCRGGDRRPPARRPRPGRPGRHRSGGAWRSR